MILPRTSQCRRLICLESVMDPSVCDFGAGLPFAPWAVIGTGGSWTMQERVVVLKGAAPSDGRIEHKRLKTAASWHPLAPSLHPSRLCFSFLKSNSKSITYLFNHKWYVTESTCVELKQNRKIDLTIFKS